MLIKQISIQNFRGIKELNNFSLKKLSLIIGENGTSKTSILEAINFALSPYFLSGRIKHTDFYNGDDVVITIILEFSEKFSIFIPDGYTKQEVDCNKICLKVKKRDKATPNKAFSDTVVVSHYVLPVREKDNEKGWEIERKTGTKFQFSERQLTFPLDSEGLPKSFYFPKNRERQLQKGFNSSISSVFDDFNWRFNKEIRKIETEESYDGVKFTTQKNDFETNILDKIDEKSRKKIFDTLNNKLQNIGLPQADLSFLDGNAPFDSAFLSQKFDGFDLPTAQLGSGIEMVTSLLFLETMAEISKENILILIDEPELHLHPSLQRDFIGHIVSNTTNNQYLFSTHSPLFVKQFLNSDGAEIQIHCLEKVANKVETIELEKKVLPYLSANEINFIAFGLATEEYHNELYNELETNYWDDLNNDFKALKNDGNYSDQDGRQIIFDNESFSKQKEEPINGPFKDTQNKVTVHTYIRNKIHHSKENGGSPTVKELSESIAKLREFLS